MMNGRSGWPNELRQARCSCVDFQEMVPPARFELTTCGLGNRRSILLSYGGTARLRRFCGFSASAPSATDAIACGYDGHMIGHNQFRSCAAPGPATMPNQRAASATLVRSRRLVRRIDPFSRILKARSAPRGMSEWQATPASFGYGRAEVASCTVLRANGLAWRLKHPCLSRCSTSPPSRLRRAVPGPDRRLAAEVATARRSRGRHWAQVTSC